MERKRCDFGAPREAGHLRARRMWPARWPVWSRSNVAMLCVGSLIGLISGEIAARVIGFGDPPIIVLDDRIEYYLLPGQDYRRFGQEIKINRHGMRSVDADLAGLARSATFTVFGDSIVFGYGLDQAATPVSELTRLLQHAGSHGALIVNSVASSSWGPENILNFYERFGPFPGNVAWVVQSTHDMVDAMHQPNDPPPYKSARTVLALEDLGLSLWRRIGPRLGLGGRDPQTFEDKRLRCDLALDRLITRLKTDYARVIITFHANRDEVVAGHAQGDRHFRDMASKHGVAFVSTIDIYRKAMSSGVRVHFDDIHLSAAGAGVLARELAAHVEDVR